MKTYHTKAEKKSFGELITTLRETAKLTKEKLAWDAGLNFTTIFRIENGEVYPDMYTRISLEKALKTKPCVLVFFHLGGCPYKQ